MHAVNQYNQTNLEMKWSLYYEHLASMWKPEKKTRVQDKIQVEPFHEARKSSAKPLGQKSGFIQTRTPQSL
jgi:hypothetical protein